MELARSKLILLEFDYWSKINQPDLGGKNIDRFFWRNLFHIHHREICFLQAYPSHVEKHSFCRFFETYIYYKNIYLIHSYFIQSSLVHRPLCLTKKNLPFTLYNSFHTKMLKKFRTYISLYNFLLIQTHYLLFCVNYSL